MELSFALTLAADHYREGYFTTEYAARRIEDIRALFREYCGGSDTWLNATIPPLDLTNRH